MWYLLKNNQAVKKDVALDSMKKVVKYRMVAKKMAVM